MPRQARIDTADALHHVMSRGINRAPILIDDRDREEFLSRADAAFGWAETLAVRLRLVDVAALPAADQVPSEPEGLPRPMLDALLVAAASALGVSVDAVRAPGKRAPATHARRRSASSATGPRRLAVRCDAISPASPGWRASQWPRSCWLH